MKYVKAYTYDTADPTYCNIKGDAIQSTDQWVNLCCLLHLLGITVLY